MIRFFDRYKAPGGLWPVSRQTAGRRFQFRGLFHVRDAVGGEEFGVLLEGVAGVLMELVGRKTDGQATAGAGGGCVELDDAADGIVNNVCPGGEDGGVCGFLEVDNGVGVAVETVCVEVPHAVAKSLVS